MNRNQEILYGNTILGQKTPGMICVDWKFVCIGLCWCLKVSIVENGAKSLWKICNRNRPTQQTILPWADIMIGKKAGRDCGSAIFQVRDLIFWPKAVSTYSIQPNLVMEAWGEVDNWASGGQSHLTDFQKVENLGSSEARSEASGDAWDGFGWQESCFYWSLLMFGSVWDCLMLVWDDLGQHICYRPANRPYCLDPI